MSKRMILTTALSMLIQPAFAAQTKTERMLSRIDALTCEVTLTTDRADYTRTVTRPSFIDLLLRKSDDGQKVGLMEYIGGIGEVALAKKNRAAWAQTQSAVQTAWERQLAHELERTGYELAPIYQTVVDALDERALQAIAAARNREELKKTYAVFEKHLTEIIAEAAAVKADQATFAARGRQQLRVRPDTSNRAERIVANLKSVLPADAPPMPVVIETRLGDNPALREFFNTEVQTIRRFNLYTAGKGDSPVVDEVNRAIVKRMENTYALLYMGIEPRKIAAMRTGLIKLRGGWNPYVNAGTLKKSTLLEREEILAQVRDVSPLGKVILTATRDLPDAVPTPTVPVPPVALEQKPDRRVRVLTSLSYVMPPLRFLDQVKEDSELAEEAELQAAYDRQRADYLRKVRTYNLDDAYQAAQDKLVEEHQERHDARYAYLMYLALIRPESFAKPGALSALKGKFTKVMTPRLANADAVPSSSDLRHAANNLLMTNPKLPAAELDALLAWARIAHVMVPRLLGEHVSRADVPVIPRKPMPALPSIRSLAPITVDGVATEAAPADGEDSAAIGMFPTPDAKPVVNADVLEAQLAAEETSVDVRRLTSPLGEHAEGASDRDPSTKNIR